MNRSKPQSLKAVSLSLITIFAAAEPLAAIAKDCQGTGVNFSENLKARKGNKGESKKVCDQKCIGEVDKKFKDVEKKLEACKNVNNSLLSKKGGQGINIDIYVKNVKDRLQSTKEAHKQYVEDAEKICHSVDIETDLINKENEGIKGLSKNSRSDQKMYWEKEASMYKGGKMGSENLRDKVDSAQKRIDQKMGKNGANGDEQMNKYIDNLERAISDQVKQVRTQANQNLKARQQSSQNGLSPDDSSRPIRIKRGQEEALSSNLAKCEQAIKDVKSFNTKYDDLSRDLMVAKAETRDGRMALTERADQFAKLEAAANKELGKLGGARPPASVSTSSGTALRPTAPAREHMTPGWGNNGATLGN